jgi:hypothetical protein
VSRFGQGSSRGGHGSRDEVAARCVGRRTEIRTAITGRLRAEGPGVGMTDIRQKAASVQIGGHRRGRSDFAARQGIWVNTARVPLPSHFATRGTTDRETRVFGTAPAKPWQDSGASKAEGLHGSPRKCSFSSLSHSATGENPFRVARLPGGAATRKFVGHQRPVRVLFSSTSRFAVLRERSGLSGLAATERLRPMAVGGCHSHRCLIS